MFQVTRKMLLDTRWRDTFNLRQQGGPDVVYSEVSKLKTGEMVPSMVAPYLAAALDDSVKIPFGSGEKITKGQLQAMLTDPQIVRATLHRGEGSDTYEVIPYPPRWPYPTRWTYSSQWK